MRNFTILTLVFSLFFSNILFSEELIITYQFDQPQIVANEDGFSEIFSRIVITGAKKDILYFHITGQIFS